MEPQPQSGEFRVTLSHLSKQIDSSTLEDLKYLSQDVIGAARMEKVKTPLEFFQALEQCGKISVNDASYLAGLLESEKKYHLAEKLAPFMGGSSINNVIQESLLSINQPQHLQQNNVPENQLNTYRLLLRRISNSLDSQQVRTICYLSQEAEYAGIQHRANLNGTMLFNFFEQSVLISPKNLQYLRDLLQNVGRLDLCQWIDQYTMVHMHGQPATLNKRPAPVAPFNQYHGHVNRHPTAPPFGDHRQQQTHYDDTQYAPGSLNTIQSSHNSVQVQDQEVFSTPFQVENDDDDTGALATVNHLEQVREQRGNLESLKGSVDDVIYQNKLRQLEERELRYRRELEEKDRQLWQHQKQLQDREDTINQLTRQYEQQLHVLRQVKTDSASEQERQQQQIREYEEMIRRNHSQIEALREENAQVPAPFGPAAEKYPMIKKPHGIAVIINNSEFFTTDASNDALPNRRGSQVDEENLRVTWEYLRYDVRILRNLTASELTRQLMQIALQSHENYDSFVCCILSHGYLDGIYGTDSQPVKINDIASLFKGNFCPTLSNKPKLFFIQACRGDDEDKGVSVQKDARGDNEDALRHSLPSEADFLFGYATPPGNVSWRSPRYGSWYISKLCEVLVDNSPQQDLLSMLTMVNSKVSEAYTTQGYKQCPAPVTLLRKQVWFFPTV